MMSSKVLLLIALLATSALSQSCDITGAWEGELDWGQWDSEHYEDIEMEATVKFKDDGTFTTTGDTWVYTDLLECEVTMSGSGTYNLTSSDELTLTLTECSFSHCSGDNGCAYICDQPWDGSEEIAVTDFSFTSSCDSFRSGHGYFYKKTSYWWVWLLVSLAVVGFIGMIAAVVVGVGFVFWKKKQASTPSFETFES